MNYRHIYHAGNFADLHKHIILSRITTYLQKKEGAFRFLDTHAGTGLYDLRSEEAQKTGEWQDGIGRIKLDKINQKQRELIQPYIDVINELNPKFKTNKKITKYPGSPLLVRKLMRKQDRLSAIELHEEDFNTLKSHFVDDFQARIIHLDGWMALVGHLPPKEKRGVVLVDPPFEEEGDYDRLVDGLTRAYRRWPGGTYCLWYPLTYKAPLKQFWAKLKAANIPKILCSELVVERASSGSGLYGSGMVIINPPYVLEDEITTIFNGISPLLGNNTAPYQKTTWLAGEFSTKEE